MSQIKFNAPWHDLKHAWVGSTYSPEFYEPIKNKKIRDSLQKIACETEEDYQGLIKILKDFGVKIDRPQIDPATTIMDFVSNNGCLDFATSKSFTLIPKPPMQPRDSILVVGDQLITTSQEGQWFYPEAETCPESFDAPMATVIGNHIIADCRDYPWLATWISQRFPDRNVIPVMIGGHNDAVFCPVRPGLIVSTYHHDNYRDTFPGWEVHFIQNQSWNAIPSWRKYKHSNVEKWWIPDDDNNPEFAEFVETWLAHWLGYVQETVFDVNMLSLDSKTILVNNYNKEMFDFFKSKNIEPIVATFRHRFFWDGGIHCITSDIYREGENDDFITNK